MLNIVLLLMILQSYLKLICDTCTFTTINLSIAIVSETFPKTGKCISSYALHKMSYLSSQPYKGSGNDHIYNVY